MDTLTLRCLRLAAAQGQQHHDHRRWQVQSHSTLAALALSVWTMSDRWLALSGHIRFIFMYVCLLSIRRR